jgi:hypothetical protein
MKTLSVPWRAVIGWRKRRGFAKALADALLIVVFVGGLALGLARGLLLTEPAVPAYENRAPARWPGWSQLTTKRLERWFNDRVGFRQELLDAHAISRWRWFGLPVSPAVAVGPNGWLFLQQSSLFDRPLGRQQGRDDHLRRWVEHLDERRRWLAERGIRYLVVIAPDKQSIYPEELPRSLQFLDDHPLLGEFHTRARDQGIETIDLVPVLREAKARGRIYLINDTHWNGMGSWFATRAVLARLGVATRQADYRKVVYPFPAPDLVRYLGAERRDEEWDTLELIGSFEFPHPLKPRFLSKVLFLHDSFGLSMIDHARPYLPSLEREATIDLPRERIERDRPAIVIQEIVERTLKARPPGSK